MHPVDQYVEDVLEGRIVTGRLARLAVERHVCDLETGADRGLYFDREAALHRLEFYQFCHHFEGEWAEQVFEPSPWQQFIKWNVYGWKRENGLRRFTEAYTSVGRKAGKTTDLATDGLYLAGCDGEPGAQVYSAATKRDQAKIVFEHATKMIARSAELRAIFKVAGSAERPIAIFAPDFDAKFVPLGRDNKTDDGLNPHAALIDEYHAHPNAAMYEILESAMGARRQPLILTITTRGFDIDCACYEFEELIIEILEGHVAKDNIFGVIHTIDPDDDWKDEGCWPKANPNLGVSIDMEKLREHFDKALIIPSEEINFKTKRLNMWTEAKSLWLTSEAWEACGFPVDEKALEGKLAWGGLDLSTTTDFTAWVLAIKANGKINLLPRFFVPEGNVLELEKKLKVPLRKWIEQGHIIATPGNVVDYDMVEDKMIDDRKRFKLDEYGFDPWNATQVNTRAEKAGMVPVEYRQGEATMNPICKAFEKHILAREVAHGNHPVLAWMCRCTEVIVGNNDNIRLAKPKRKESAKRIDGIVAAVMAVARAEAGNAPKESVYKERGFLTL